eukprot:COSAG06_NODE_39411_length_413_cov_0.636943_2_plen_38_part_01
MKGRTRNALASLVVLYLEGRQLAIWVGVESHGAGPVGM